MKESREKSLSPRIFHLLFETSSQKEEAKEKAACIHVQKGRRKKKSGWRGEKEM